MIFEVLAVTLSIFVLDTINFSVFGGWENVYAPAIRAVTGKPPSPPDTLAALLSWLCVGTLALAFAKCPALDTWHIAALGALVYGVFDFTTKAMFPDYPWRAVLIDIAWGAFVTTAGALLARHLMKKSL